MKRFLCSALIVVCFSLTAKGEPNKPNVPKGPNEPNAVTLNKKMPLFNIKDCALLSKRAGGLIQQSKFEEAYDLLQSYYVSFLTTPDQKNVFLTNLNAMVQAAIPVMGRQIADGFEYIGVLKLSNSDIAVYFLSKHQFGGVVWRFAFYKPYDEWKFRDVGFGPDVAGDIMMLAKPVEVKMDSEK